MKICTRCGDEKELTDFAVRGVGWTSWCLACHREYQLQKKYGITEREYWLLVVAQQGQCAVCGTTNPGRTRHREEDQRFRIDHDHETNKIRGLLCHSCNTAIGHVKDDPAVIRAAADYVEAHRILQET